MATSSFEQKFVIRDEDAKKRFFEVYNGNDGVTINNLDEKSQALKAEAAEGIEILKKKLTNSSR